MATEFAYTSVPNALRQYLKGIPQRAIPPKVSGKYLKSIGLKSSNDRTIISVLKFVGFLDGSGSPTTEYKNFRDQGNGAIVLAELIRKAYKSLFDTYSDAHAQSDEDLSNFFKANTEVGERAVQYLISTFKVLCEFGNFSGSSKDVLRTGQPASTPGASGTGSATAGPEVHVNLQIHLPDAKDPATYDAIFDAMARSLRKIG